MSLANEYILSSTKGLNNNRTVNHLQSIFPANLLQSLTCRKVQTHQNHLGNNLTNSKPNTLKLAKTYQQANNSGASRQHLQGKPDRMNHMIQNYQTSQQVKRIDPKVNKPIRRTVPSSNPRQSAPDRAELIFAL